MSTFGIDFPAPKSMPIKMAALGLSNSSTRIANTLPIKFPLRSSAEIEASILSNDLKTIPILEWLIYFRDLKYWSVKQNNSATAKLCVAVFQVVAKDSLLANLLIVMAARSIEDSTQFFPSQILTNISLAKNQINRTAKDDAGVLFLHRVDVLLAAKESDYTDLLTLCLKANQSPTKYFASLGLDALVNTLSELKTALVGYINEIDIPLNEGWIYECASQLTEKDRLLLIKTVAPSLKKLDGPRSQLEDWIKNISSPENETGLWALLDYETQALLAAHFQFSNFLSIVAALIRFIETSKLDDMNSNRIRSRYQFWRNYSESILDARLLTTKGTAPFFDSKKADILQNENDDGEVLVLTFKNHLVATFMRGAGPETRIYSRTKQTENLIVASKCSGTKIRLLYQDQILDHRLYWQQYAERKLRVDFNIRPNKGVKSFKGIGAPHNVYFAETGLPLLEKKQQQERDRDLEEFREFLYQREKKLGKYNSDADPRTIAYLLGRAREAKRLGNSGEMRKALNEAIKMGSEQAKRDLGRWLVSYTRGTETDRRSGEKLLREINEWPL